MKFTMLFGRPTNHSCYASRVLLNRRRGLALKPDVVIVQRADAWRISWLRDRDTAQLCYKPDEKRYVLNNV
jgi:hypothetical protein